MLGLGRTKPHPNSPFFVLFSAVWIIVSSHVVKVNVFRIVPVELGMVQNGSILALKV